MVCETYADAFTCSTYYFLLEFVWGSDWGLCQTSWWGTDLQKKQNGQLVLPVAVCDFRYWGELIHIITQLANFSTLVLCCFSLDKFRICMDYVQILWSIVHVIFLMLKIFMYRLIYWKIIFRLRIYVFPREPKSTFPGIRRKWSLEQWLHLHIQWWAKVRNNEFGRNLCFIFILDFYLFFLIDSIFTATYMLMR